MAVPRGDTIDKAIALKSDADVVEFLRQKMPESLKVLQDIACGNVPRNAQSILKGIELQLRYSQPLPKQVVEHQGSVGIAVIDPYAEEPGSFEAPAPAAPPPPAPVAPLVRKKKKEVGP